MSIPKLPFGRTGHDSTRIIFGGASLARVDQAAADRTLDVLLEHGINHIDVAASYGDAELRIGPWLTRHRQDFFVATKTGSGRPKARATSCTAPSSGWAWTTSICGSSTTCPIQSSGTRR